MILSFEKTLALARNKKIISALRDGILVWSIVFFLLVSPLGGFAGLWLGFLLGNTATMWRLLGHC
ncbi:hypothetical protein FUAX_33360 [Fulvitalea axinellae]|uniref:Uncharacterized protein n=1 Tax=Fulvitalea axinellae TaxID=1182444 RepID=A0AAU9CFF5_9BACT|nr:hypothetical protein FUAX_33360 [Fulvitalea axinellae]